MIRTLMLGTLLIILVAVALAAGIPLLLVGLLEVDLLKAASGAVILWCGVQVVQHAAYLAEQRQNKQQPSHEHKFTKRVAMPDSGSQYTIAHQCERGKYDSRDLVDELPGKAERKVA